MFDIEKQISPLIESQFPDFYQEEGQLFVAFIKAYYEWMEKNQFIDANDNTVKNVSPALYHSRRLPEYRDIDTTLDDFILSFKNKYLSNIQFNVASNKKLFIKNSLDFYRSKGTEQAVDLFFKLIYGLEARIYTPADDLFRPSDNTWINVNYLEVVGFKSNLNMLGRMVYGSLSNASGYAERINRVKKGGRYIDVIQLANITGDFKTGEQVETRDLTQNVTTKIIGSFSNFDVTLSTPGFTIGEQLYVDGGNGKRGKATVANTANYTGVIEFELLNGGWGYTNTAEVQGSDVMFNFSTLSITNNQVFAVNNPYQTFEIVRQDLVRLNFANIEPFSVGDNLFAYHANNDVSFKGSIVSIDVDSEFVTVNYDADTYSNTLILTTNTFYTTANASNYTVSSNNLNVTATGNVIGTSVNMLVEYTTTNIDSDSTLRLKKNDVVYQKHPSDKIYANGNVTGLLAQTNATTGAVRYFLDIDRNVGVFRNNEPFYRLPRPEESDAVINTEYTISGISNVNMGVIDVTNPFYDSANVVGTTSGTIGNARRFTYQTEAAFTVKQTFAGDVVDAALSESQQLENFYSNELISDISGNTIINFGVLSAGNTSPGYGSDLLYNTSNNIEYTNTSIQNAIGLANIEIGSIDSIITTNPGRGYPVDPYFIIYEPKVKHMERYDFEIVYNKEAEEKNFIIGETIQLSTNSNVRAKIYYHNQNKGILWATRIHLADNWTTTDDMRPGTIIRGVQSDVTAGINTIFEMRDREKTGLNAKVRSTALSGNGFITQLNVIDSGYGYFDGETVTLISFLNSERTVAGQIKHGKQGVAPGVHDSRKSFLSSDKYLHDNDFYQEYSYQVLTALPFDKYKDILLKVLHTAGTKPFGGYVGTSEVPVSIETKSSTAEFDIKKFDLFVNTNEFYSATIA